MAKSALALKKADDLFEKSSMSFGDHLEELRRALLKASIWLAVGLVVGLPSATTVLKFMQVPLQTSLNKYFDKKNQAEMKASAGAELSPELSKWLIDEKKISQVVFLDMRRVKAALEGTLGEKEVTAPDSLGLPPVTALVAFRQYVGINSNAEALGLQEPFMLWFKAGLVVAFLVASPGIFFHIWQFISAGLYPHERRYVYFFLPTSLFLFWSGAALAFLFIFTMVIDFLLEFNAMLGIEASPRVTDYMEMAVLLPLGFGISFQLPLVMLILERLGILSIQLYVTQWRMAILIIAFLSMILTPNDVGSMLGMAIPLIGLYFVGIGMCKYLPRSDMLRGEAVDPK
ncbi:MAG: twin-arginine translocase subunit TatC [Planctomycetota bacterium]|jgi:sec-independent protein translocase protein TatC|nr:twin-arginine translocase subunit TatC [Planctomycetota bacterium]